MKHINISHRTWVIALYFIMAVGFSYVAVLPAHSHGGKTHSEEVFTALQAAQKAIQLYDRLIVSGKLPEVWETGLKNIKISTRNRENNREYVVQFETIQENPSSVYFFFDQNGKYSGSNFTGK